jgi:hypothetical protein
MADASAHTPIFARGSTVLDYWLAHAEGLTIQPSGARVEEVVATAPVGRIETLVVRSRMTRRRREIPADAIVAVEPSLGRLLLGASSDSFASKVPRPSPERLAWARASAARGGRIAGERAVGAARSTHAGSRSAISWAQPRAARGVEATARQSRLAARKTADGIAWLSPRIIAGARSAAATVLRLALGSAVLIARGASYVARKLERSTATAAERGLIALEARRALKQRPPDD